MHERVAAALGMDASELAEDADLMELGLDSLRLMAVVGDLRRNGVGVTFADLAADPTIRAWQRLVARAGTAVAATPATTAVTPAPTDAAVEPFELNLLQHTYWVGRQDEQPLGGVGAHFYVEFDGRDVNPELLRSAVIAVRRRHPMLRTTVLSDGRQHLARHVADDAITVHDLRGAEPDRIVARLAELRDHHTHRRMDVEHGELLEVALTHLPEGVTRLHIDLDMIAADALSMRILLADLRAYYTTPDVVLPSLHTDYAGYLAARRIDRAAAWRQSRDWWRARLPELSEPPRLPVVVDVHSAESAQPRYRRSARYHHWLSPEAKDRLHERARRHRVSPASALATAFAETLAAWSGEQRFLLNLPLFDREGAEGLVGDFSSSILVDVDLTRARSFAESAAAIQAVTLEAIGHSAFSGVEVLRERSRANGGTPALAPVVYTSAIGLGEIYERELQDTFGEPVWIISQNPQVLLDAQVTELDGGLLLNWDFREHAFAPGVVTAAFAAYRGLVDDLVADDETWNRPVGTLLPPDQAAVRAAVNNTDGPAPTGSLHGEFFRIATEEPHRTALYVNGAEVSYGNLAARALSVATLLRDNGIQPGDTVAITLPKGLDQVVAVLGVLAAGAAYVPIGVDHPEPRRARIRRSAGVRALITDAACAPDAADCPVLHCAQAAGLEPVQPAQPGPDAPAYVIFTSGSTGEPKGVEVSHGAVINTITAVGDLFEVGAHDRTIALSALDFDLSAYDLFALLRVGGAVVLIAEHERRDARRWSELINTHRVSVLSCVPALLDMLLAAADTLPTSVRLVMLGGDWVGMDQPARLRALVPDVRFVALGGMTEAAIHTTVFEVERVHPDWRSIPYGTPLRNMRTRVVDGRGRDCPDWVPGELWVSGAGLANGYRGDADRTAVKFVDHDGRRWYRTGDHARYRGDGVLEFLGRADHQVKIRGHRIELGEIEATAAAHPAVTAAVATVLTAPARRLALMADGTLSEAELREWLTGQLPGHLVPEQLTIAPIPLTSNGKLDRASVAASLAEHQVEVVAAQPPSGWAELAVAHAFSKVLGVVAPGRDDSFFALGGDSLLATRVVSLLLPYGASIGRLFAAPRLRDFAATLCRPDEAAERTATSTPAVAVSDPAGRYEPFPATDAQRAYWLGRDDRFTLGGVGTYHYTEFDGVDVDMRRLEDAWRLLIGRHDMLRAVFDKAGRQRVLEAVPDFRITVEEVGDEAAAGDALARLRATQSHRLLDLTSWPLFAVHAVRYPRHGQQRTRIAIGLDYTVLDARSIMTLYAELDLAYREPNAVLPSVDFSFRDYVLQAAWPQDAVALAEKHSLARLDELPPAPALPSTGDSAPPRFTRRELTLDPSRWEIVRERCRQYGLTPSTVLLACYGEVLAAWSGQSAVAVTLTLFNRRPVHPHVDRVLGDFSTFSVIGYAADPSATWLTAVRALHRTLGEDLEHQAVSTSWLLRELARRTDTVAAAVPVVFTSALGLGDTELSSGFPPKVFGLSQSPQVLLDNQVTESGGSLVLTWDAVEAQFPAGVLDAMFDAYRRLLDSLVDSEWSGARPALLPDAQRAVRTAVNATARELPVALLHEPFFRLARLKPDAIALLWADGSLSYGELADQALRIAGTLRAKGVRPGEVVAVSLPKGPAQIAAVLGVLAAGAAYVPVGIDQPPVRRERMLQVAQARVVIAQGDEFGAEPLANPVERSVDDLAYLIFTSGSTGDPKAVAITHRAAGNTVADISDRFALGARDRVLALSALDFDLSVFDIFGLLGVGGALVLPDEQDRRDPTAWLRLASLHRVTVWNTAPMLLDLLLTAAELNPDLPVPQEIRLALLSGDWVGLDLPRRLRAVVDTVRFIALGGATEASIWSNSIEVDAVPPEWTSVPYGLPLANQRYRVVDDLGRDCPDWTAGELWIGGLGVASGYWGASAADAARFVDCSGERWYRTGDRGRYWPDGTLEFLGRTDHQVKIGGHRVELGEIEAALRAHPGVSKAVVLASGERAARRLRAFVVTDDLAVPADLAGHLADRLPDYAVPRQIDALAEIPLTRNGKVDRVALLAQDGDDAPAAEEPRDEVEIRIAELWREQLGCPVTNRHENFFALGGDSLSVLRCVNAVNETFLIDLPVQTFLRTPTVAALARETQRLKVDQRNEESGSL
ncbi:non-ribosomal peptide synthetase [Kibdelosporangium philippinense]|uniref:non-ribosomal peptide synthetase n=1 Tax=Kibdelosporangium philippinense TaxID=211113 RepID=UPI0024C365BF|nr:non-ribosomal peptide synthetase [Kibdelosporangium philippinense]